MNFTAIDFETAHACFPCEIGLTRVENGEITASKSWLIKPACFPYMNPYHERVHGISPTQLVSAPTFEELWSELKLYLDEQLVVAHNAPFDMGVLRASLAYYDLAVPWIDYFCSVQLSRKVWKQLTSHSLGNLCQFHNISFNHHRAGDDAKACASIVLKAFENIDSRDIVEGLNNLKVKIKKLKK
jgi:DNA polymerase-3 subunit epsilon